MMFSLNPSTSGLTKVAGAVRIIHITDVHFLHPLVPSSDIGNNLLLLLDGLKDKETIDYIIITGDLFDMVGVMTRADARATIKFIEILLAYCVTFGIRLIILEGTPGHDNGQSRYVVELNEARTVKADVKYVTDIEKWVEPNGLRFIGVPDAIRGSVDIIKSEVSKLLASEPDGKVDVMLTHGGYLHHQIPGAHDVHDGRWYNKKVIYIILNGHIHTRSLVGRIQTGGSCERLRQNEEEAKGIHDTVLHLEEKTFTSTFIENKNTRLFLTCDTSHLTDIPAIIDYITLKLESTPQLQKDFLRIIHARGVIIQEVLKIIKERFPRVTMTHEAAKKAKEIDKPLEEAEEFKRIQVLPITATTVTDLVKDKLLRMGESDDNINVVLQMLDERIKEVK